MVPMEGRRAAARLRFPRPSSTEAAEVSPLSMKKKMKQPRRRRALPPPHLPHRLLCGPMARRGCLLLDVSTAGTASQRGAEGAADGAETTPMAKRTKEQNRSRRCAPHGEGEHGGTKRNAQRIAHCKEEAMGGTQKVVKGGPERKKTIPALLPSLETPARRPRRRSGVTPKRRKRERKGHRVIAVGCG